jgi:hypothetical protein
MTKFRIRSVLISLLLALPGIILTLSAKPLLAPELFSFGIVFALGLPAIWLISRPD